MPLVDRITWGFAILAGLLFYIAYILTHIANAIAHSRTIHIPLKDIAEDVQTMRTDTAALRHTVDLIETTMGDLGVAVEELRGTVEQLELEVSTR